MAPARSAEAAEEPIDAQRGATRRRTGCLRFHRCPSCASSVERIAARKRLRGATSRSSAAADILQERLNRRREHIGLWKEADNEERFALEIKKISGMHEDAGLVEQLEHHRLFRNEIRDLHNGVPSGLHRQDRTRWMRSSECRKPLVVV